jgi:transposase-like protein
VPGDAGTGGCQRTKKFPPEFKPDVVTVARRGERNINDVVSDFDIPPESVRRMMRQADIDDGVRDGLTTAEHLQPTVLAPEPHTSCCRVLRSGPAPKMKFPLVLDVAAQGFPVR